MGMRWMLFGVTGLGAGFLYLLHTSGGPRRRHAGIDLHISMTIRAEADQVYAFWTNHENFQRVMKHVRDVRVVRNGHIRWVVTGPSGAPMGWEARLVTRAPGRMLAWKTKRGSPPRHRGSVRFIDHRDGTTTLDLEVTYYPDPATRDATTARSVKSMVEAELIRMKTALESGIVPSDRRKTFRGASPIPRFPVPRKSA